MNKNGMKGIIRYATQKVELQFLLLVGVFVGMFLYMFAMGGNYSVEGMLEETNMLSFYTLWILPLFYMIFQVSFTILQTDMQLGMGATRKEILWGQFYYRGLFSVQLLLFSLLINWLAPSILFDGWGEIIVANLATFLMINGIGIFLSLLIDRFGKVAYYIFVALAALLGGVCGGASVILLGLKIIVWTIPMIGIYAILAGVGLVLTVIGGLVMNFYMKNRAVHI